MAEIHGAAGELHKMLHVAWGGFAYKKGNYIRPL